MGKSHPAWVRGLKQVITSIDLMLLVSHPAWVRGLKHIQSIRLYCASYSRTLRGCVD